MKTILNILILLTSFSVFGEIKFPDPKIQQDKDLEERTRGNLPERKKIAIKFLHDYYNAYVSEFKKLNPEAPSPFEGSTILQGYESYINEKITDEELNAPIGNFLVKLKAELDHHSTIVSVQNIAPEEIARYVAKHEVAISGLESRIKNGVVNAPVPVEQSNPTSSSSKPTSGNGLIDAYGVYVALGISLLNLIILLLKK